MNSRYKILVLAAGMAVLVAWMVGRRVDSKVADAVEKFAAEATGAKSVTVYSLNSLPLNTVEESEVNEQHFHRFPILKSVAVTDEKKCRQIVAAVVGGLRTKANGAKCFEPNHGIRISHGGGVMDVVICYSCELVQAWGGEFRGQYEVTADTSEEVLRQVLK